jgi:hypothetical protein
MVASVCGDEQSSGRFSVRFNGLVAHFVAVPPRNPKKNPRAVSSAMLADISDPSITKIHGIVVLEGESQTWTMNPCVIDLLCT